MFVAFSRAWWVAVMLGVASAVTAAEDPPPDPGGEVLRLPGALARVLERSPELAPFSAGIRATEARALQASLFPNPGLAVEVEDAVGGGDFRGGRRAETTLQLSQLVELGGKRGKRRTAARRAVDLARSRFEEKRIEVLGEATARFVDVLERQHALDLAGEAVRLEERTLATLRRRLRGGLGSPLEEKRAEVALAGSRLDLEDAGHELEVAKAALAATWGASSPDFGRVEASLFVRRPVPEWEALRARVAGSPGMLRLESEERLRAAEIRLARALAVPDVTLSAGPRRIESSDDHTVVFGLSMPLPVFDRNPGGVAEARALGRGSRAERKAAAVRLEAFLYRTWQELRHAGHVLDVLEGEVLPAADSAQRTASGGFASGRFSHLELLDTRRAFLEARRRRIEAAASFHRLVLELERATGAPLEPGESDLVQGELP